MVRNDNADVAVFQFGDDVLDILHGNRVHPGERFVQENEFRVHGQRAGNLTAPAFTAGELDAEGFTDLGEIELRNQAFQPLLALGTGHLAGRQGHFHHGEDVVLHRHFPEDRCLLGKIADPQLGPFVHGQFGDLRIVQENMPAIRDDLAGNHVEAGRLAGSVRAEEADNLSLFHFHRDALHHRSDAIFLHEFFCSEFHLISYPGRGQRQMHGLRDSFPSGLSPSLRACREPSHGPPYPGRRSPGC